MRYCVVETSRGFVALAGHEGRLAHCTLPRSTRQDALTALGAGVTGSAVEDDAALGSLPGMLKAYYAGERVDFSRTPIDTTGRGPFHAAALAAAKGVPYGTVVTYGELARMAGSPLAARAVGNAMSRNTMPVVVPCHRVIASGGRIGGFSSGLEWKRELLKLEGVDI